jgi:metal transporter CNNM|tara:strand:+ start:1066 stop:2718 length:1653 start_codon:yes stop_codon:yes gene_type:complete
MVNISLIEIVLIIVLICLSGLFSGLTLGLLGLDPIGLEIIMSGNTKDSIYARSILPIRKKGNQLLCTLLLGNVLVNSALSIIMADITSGIIGLVLSTTIIVIFGEIIPQSTCSRYSLLIGYKTRWITHFLLIILFPIAFPMSFILDKFFGNEVGMIYSNTELKRLVKIHETEQLAELQTNVANIMTGALNLETKFVKDVMMPWDNVYKININDRLNFEILLEIFKKGYSRIPVFSNNSNEDVEIVGILFVKELILLDPEDEIPVSSIINTFEHQILKVATDYKLNIMLNDFCSGKGHIAIVKEKTTNNMGLFTEKNVGIVTLEDLLEFILQVDIIDETDIALNRNKQDKYRKFDMNKLKLFDYRRKKPDFISPQEIKAVVHHLKYTYHFFRTIPSNSIENLIQNSKVIEVLYPDNSNKNFTMIKSPYDMIEQNGLMVYKKNEKSNFMSVILDGKLEIHSGKNNFLSEVSRWFVLCPDIFESVYKSYINHTRPINEHIVDFSARVVSNCRILRISKNDFYNELNKNDSNCNSPSQNIQNLSENEQIEIEIQ